MNQLDDASKTVFDDGRGSSVLNQQHFYGVYEEEGHSGASVRWWELWMDRARLLTSLCTRRIVNYEAGKGASKARSLWRLEPLRIR